MADQQATTWVCPWDICDHDQAQACRAEQHPRKGCGGRFPEGTTPEQAKALISAPPMAEGCEFCLAPSFAAKRCPLCGRVPHGVAPCDEPDEATSLERRAIASYGVPAAPAPGVTIHLTRDPATGEVLECDFPVCAVHHICDRNCTRNAGVKGVSPDRAKELLRSDPRFRTEWYRLYDDAQLPDDDAEAISLVSSNLARKDRP